MERQTIDISWGTLWRALFFVLLATVVVLAHKILLGLFLAIVISSGVEVIVSFLEKRRIPRTLGILVVFLFVALIVAVVVYFVIPLLITDLTAFFARTDESSFRAWADRFLATEVGQSVNELLRRLTREFFVSGLSPLGAFADILGGVGLAVAVIISSFYLSIRRDGVDRFITAVFPDSLEEKALRIYARARRKIGWWFQGQIFLSVIIWLLVWGSLSLLGVPNAFILGALAGVLEIVPFVGPILSGAAAVLVAFTISTTLAIYALIAFLLIQQFESNFLVPVLMKKAIGLHPVIVIMSLLIGIELWGFLGALIAVPAAAVLQEIIEARSVVEEVVE